MKLYKAVSAEPIRFRNRFFEAENLREQCDRILLDNDDKHLRFAAYEFLKKEMAAKGVVIRENGEVSVDPKLAGISGRSRQGEALAFALFVFGKATIAIEGELRRLEFRPTAVDSMEAAIIKNCADSLGIPDVTISDNTADLDGIALVAVEPVREGPPPGGGKGKIWCVEVVVSDPGNRDEPPSQDSHTESVHRHLSVALRRVRTIIVAAEEADRAEFEAENHFPSRPDLEEGEDNSNSANI